MQPPKSTTRLYKGRVLIALNTTWNLANFRSGLILSLLKEGYEVIAVAPPDEHVERVKALGCRYVPFPMDNQGTNPLKDFRLLLRFLALFLRERPDVYLGFTVKPNVYGSLAAHVLRIPTINNIAGLGAVFISKSWLTVLVRRLYALALCRSAKVFFQNKDDQQFFLAGNLVKQNISDLVPGSGIDVSAFHPAPFPAESKPMRFLLIARMLWDKGVGEFIDAARLLKKSGLDVEFCLLGFTGVANPAAISQSQMDAWVDEGIVRYLGSTSDVRPHIAAAHCVVLPSYREGVPRTLLEAAAMARPLIATDVPGCRDVVDDAINGYLCRIKSAADLAAKVEKFTHLSLEAQTAMGKAGRKKIEREFNEGLVIAKYLKAIQQALA